MIIISLCLLLAYSLLSNIRSPHLRKIGIMSGVTLLLMVPGYLWCKEACVYILLLFMMSQSIYLARAQGDSYRSCFLQSGIYILAQAVWSVLLIENVTIFTGKNTGYTMLVLDLMFITVRLRDEMVLRRFESYSASYQNKLLHNQVEEVHNIYMTMRGWRHDYHSHLQSLKVKLDQNQINEAKQYLNELEQDLNEIRQLVESGNVNVDAILNSKLSLAIAQNIDVNVKVVIPERLPLSDIDCCVLLGNLIDNAIEACEKVEENKFIRLYIGIYKKQLYLSITNATNEVVRKFDDEYITTKRGNHGHGLKRINKVVEKYNGYINRKNEPGVFVCEIMLSI